MPAITQNVLSKLMKKRAALQSMTEEITKLETELLERLKAGAIVRPGLLIAEIKRIERRNVAWRPAFEREISKRDGEGRGAQLAERILAATKPAVYENLSVKLIG
jgi:uncharacterized protein with von Willebrand factor type A (vWA) domain